MFQPLLDPHAVTFNGRRLAAGAEVTITVDGKTESLPPRLDLRNHSPNGFEWGYSGSGPAQLALAMCAALVGDRVAERVYQGVKERRVSGIHCDEWTMSGSHVLRAIEAECTWREGETS